MNCYLGIDTSNYTTSLAIYNHFNDEIIQQKKLLPVKSGEVGLRQSDAVFHHTKQLPMLMKELFDDENYKVSSIAVSSKPRNEEGSYMPCFLAGEGLAESLATVLGVKLHKTSHQVGHILAGLFSCGQLGMVSKPFLAFHVSGGTTECLLVTPDDENVINCKLVAKSLDLKCGQAVDRVGVMLGLNFPCGKELDLLSQKSSAKFKIKPSIIGNDCSLSGLENKCKTMYNNGEKAEDIAKFTFDYILETISAMTVKLKEKFPDFPVLYVGGVMANSIISKGIMERHGGFFASPEYSCDNASGIAIYSFMKEYFGKEFIIR